VPAGTVRRPRERAAARSIASFVALTERVLQTGAMAPPLLSIENATVFRGDTRVLDRFSLEIPAGRSTAILGPNGAGKTTLLQLLTRDLYPVWAPDAHVRLFGEERFNLFDLRRRLGIVSQELHLRHQREVSALDVVLSGYHASIGLWRRDPPTGERLAHARSILARMGVTHLEDRSFVAMSAGEQRRCLLGRALVNDPPTLLLDEPTVSLDLRAAFELIAILRDLAREGRTLVLVTHHLDEIPPEIGWVILLKRGRVVAQGPREEMLADAPLSDLFDVPLRVVRSAGFSRAVPANGLVG
jgi:iron complex transport system ATP-binding protein